MCKYLERPKNPALLTGNPMEMLSWVPRWSSRFALRPSLQIAHERWRGRRVCYETSSRFHILATTYLLSEIGLDERGPDSYQDSESQLPTVEPSKDLVMCSSDFPCKRIRTQSDEVMDRDTLASSFKMIEKNRRVEGVVVSWRNLALVLRNTPPSRVDKLSGSVNA